MINLNEVDRRVLWNFWHVLVFGLAPFLVLFVHCAREVPVEQRVTALDNLPCYGCLRVYGKHYDCLKIIGINLVNNKNC
jgi:hypothetical protein